MRRFLIHTCPALMDGLLFLTNFAVFYRAGEQHFTLNQCAWLAGISSFSYMLNSLIAGFALSRSNARLILSVSIVFNIFAVIVCLYAVQFHSMLAGMTLLGISGAFFFNSFQGFIRGESPPGGLMRTIGFYTLSWSMGISFGFISSGCLYRYGVITLLLLSTALTLFMLIIIVKHKRRPLTDTSSEEHVEEGPCNTRAINARYVWIGWLMIFTAMFVQKPIMSFFPAISAAAGITPLLASLPLFSHLFIQALSGFEMRKLPRLLYRRSFLMITHLLAAVLFFVVWQRPTLPVCFLVFSLLGVYSGFAYFSCVYYSSNSGNRALNVGINEFLVGLAALAGLFVSEWWMRFTSNTAGMYAVCSVILVISAFAQFLAAWSGRKPVNRSP